MSTGSVAPLGPGQGLRGRLLPAAPGAAIATFDPDKGKSLKVFFEAREVVDFRNYDAPNPNVATQVGPMRTLAIAGSADKTPEQRVLLIGSVHSLLIDSQKCVVEKVIPRASMDRLFCVP